MVSTFRAFSAKLMLFVMLSSVALAHFTERADAHEVIPTIADLSRDAEGLVTLQLRLNIESFLANIDLDNIEDTDEAEGAQEYDALRALPGDALTDRLDGLLARWNTHPLAEAGGPLTFALTEVAIPDDVDVELPRISVLTLTAQAAGDSIVVNWPDGSGSMVLRQQGVDAPFTGYLDGGDSSEPIAFAGGGAQSASEAFFSYVPVGFDHILPKGLDHILFVLGLFFLSTRWGPLLWQVSAFTLAHTVTLALGALGWVNVPASIVEPLIAASIVYVAVENIFTQGLSRWRPFVIFGFGLLHGLGFASVLGEFGLPESQFIPALVGFNVGVELGQLTVIALAALLLMISVRLAGRGGSDASNDPTGGGMTYGLMFRAVSIPASLLIAATGAYWSIERVFF